MLRGRSFMGGTCSRMPLMVPSAAMKSMSSGRHVLCIQKLRTAWSLQEKSMPELGSSEVRNISPTLRWSGVWASSTLMRGLPGASRNTTPPWRSDGSVAVGFGHTDAGRTGVAGVSLHGTTQAPPLTRGPSVGEFAVGTVPIFSADSEGRGGADAGVEVDSRATLARGAGGSSTRPQPNALMKRRLVPRQMRMGRH